MSNSTENIPVSPDGPGRQPLGEELQAQLIKKIRDVCSGYETERKRSIYNFAVSVHSLGYGAVEQSMLASEPSANPDVASDLHTAHGILMMSLAAVDRPEQQLEPKKSTRKRRTQTTESPNQSKIGIAYQAALEAVEVPKKSSFDIQRQKTHELYQLLYPLYDTSNMLNDSRLNPSALGCISLIRSELGISERGGTGGLGAIEYKEPEKPFQQFALAQLLGFRVTKTSEELAKNVKFVTPVPLTTLKPPENISRLLTPQRYKQLALRALVATSLVILRSRQ